MTLLTYFRGFIFMVGADPRCREVKILKKTIPQLIIIEKCMDFLRHEITVDPASIRNRIDYPIRGHVKVLMWTLLPGTTIQIHPNRCRNQFISSSFFPSGSSCSSACFSSVCVFVCVPSPCMYAWFVNYGLFPPFFSSPFGLFIPSSQGRRLTNVLPADTYSQWDSDFIYAIYTMPKDDQPSNGFFLMQLYNVCLQKSCCCPCYCRCYCCCFHFLVIAGRRAML